MLRKLTVSDALYAVAGLVGLVSFGVQSVSNATTIFPNDHRCRVPAAVVGVTTQGDRLAVMRVMGAHYNVSGEYPEPFDSAVDDFVQPYGSFTYLAGDHWQMELGFCSTPNDLDCIYRTDEVRLWRQDEIGLLHLAAPVDLSDRYHVQTVSWGPDVGYIAMPVCDPFRFGYGSRALGGPGLQ